MNKQDKLKVLGESKGTYRFGRCFFNYDKNYYYLYISDYSDKLLYGIKEDNFMLDGFQIRKISDLKKIEIKDDLCVEINKENELLANVEIPKIDLSSWQTVFESLKALGGIIIVEHEEPDEDGNIFYIGYIREINKRSVLFHWFDADGKWFEPEEILYSDITNVTFRDRYSSVWKKYLERHDMLPKE